MVNSREHGNRLKVQKLCHLLAIIYIYAAWKAHKISLKKLITHLYYKPAPI
jgi:hypothetical protein